MRVGTTVQELLESGNGMIRASDAKRQGVAYKELQRLADAGLLERVQHGLYLSPDQIPDEYWITQYRCPKGIFSHDTALYLHNLSDRSPLQLTLTIPRGYNSQLIKDKESYRFFYSVQRLYELGITTVQSPHGNNLRVYDRERTLCDCLKRIDVLDADIVLTAVKQYMREKGNDFAKLLKYAEIFHIRDQVRHYMEVLL